MIRLDLVSAELTGQLRYASASLQRRAALVACEFAMEKAPIDAPEVESAIDALRMNTSISPDSLEALQKLAERLDKEYLHMMRAVDNGRAQVEAVSPLFEKARAAACIVYAFLPDNFEAATEAIYEACMTVDDRKELLDAVRAILA